MATFGAIRAARAFVEFFAEDASLKTSLKSIKLGLTAIANALPNKLLSDLHNSVVLFRYLGRASEAFYSALNNRGVREGATAAQTTAINEYNSAWARLKGTAIAVAGVLAVKLAPMMTALMNGITLAIPQVLALGEGLGRVIAEAAARGWQALQDLIGRLPDVVLAFGDSLRGMQQALQSNDWGLAARVLWLSLRSVWTKGIAELNLTWSYWKTTFLNTLYSALELAQSAWAQFRTVVAKMWISLIAATMRAIDGTTNHIREYQIQQTLDEMLGEEQKTFRRARIDRQDAGNAEFDKEVARLEQEIARNRGLWRAALGTAQARSDAAPGDSMLDATRTEFAQMADGWRSAIAAMTDRGGVGGGGGAGGIADIRTLSGQSSIINLINGPGSIPQRQLTQLQKITDQLRTQIELTRNGPQAVTV